MVTTLRKRMMRVMVDMVVKELVAKLSDYTNKTPMPYI